MDVTPVANSETEKPRSTVPAVLAPAGSQASFLAALAAGAEAIYCGLKSFSARMEAKNFTLRGAAAPDGARPRQGHARLRDAEHPAQARRAGCGRPAARPAEPARAARRRHRAGPGHGAARAPDRLCGRGASGPPLPT
ncbi:MAG: hypothetical protein MZV70_50910 [Desulfobacterales bacterium]|nr:hypothetical protein [Desulfobacterales bacterium]